MLPESELGSRALEKQNSPFPTKVVHAFHAQVIGTSIDILQKGIAPLTRQVKKLKYRRGQGRLVCNLVVLAWFPRSCSFTTEEMRMGLDHCHQISPSPLRQGHGECRRGPGLVSTPDCPLLSAPVSMRLPDHVSTRARDFFSFQNIDHLDARAEYILGSHFDGRGAPLSNSKGVTWDYDKAYGDESSYQFVYCLVRERNCRTW